VYVTISTRELSYADDAFLPKFASLTIAARGALSCRLPERGARGLL
jgi:hypothetical protein